MPEDGGFGAVGGRVDVELKASLLPPFLHFLHTFLALIVRFLILKPKKYHWLIDYPISTYFPDSMNV